MSPDIPPRTVFLQTAVPATLAIAVVIATGFALAAATGMTAVEMDFLRTVSTLHTPLLDWLALGINSVFGPRIAMVLVLLGAIAVAGATRHLSSAAYFVAVVTVPWLSNEVVKNIVHRPRPDIPSLAHPLVFEPGGFGYPSGHTTFATCLVLGVVLAARCGRGRPALVVAAVSVSLATAASRVYLGVHYPTDVIASIVYSVAGVAVVHSVWTLLVVPHWSGRRLVVDEVPARSGVPDAR
jgi:membrane-associated phospholipid phosphatase